MRPVRILAEALKGDSNVPEAVFMKFLKRGTVFARVCYSRALEKTESLSSEGSRSPDAAVA